uniref:Uncharacterized protein n=1 Tax=Cryptomonas curvata TaxID=233186 RepID=A0A7S0MQM0_9CRYP|mmetsp:Transcript_51794/g.108249  ORF Transcript_51794/g.108249 Transcript_51794/m.108249 type:complete len:146 (+) Transcript_51794:888-1325(+)|eukprot:CAMPEP_0172207812 /NCGR_PEP_ID=MMETSP1050-20130122/34073_1 /TAXON_ID=233186 /ORGANISM="Cryptomonas curvata, Strain CCAP979/52" /LENGTH=145 /DNA_ID=CAMNT_0012887231 /DNA_START=327 /DNA_END=764 /DNA_ORIENTATION=-
MKTKRIMRVIMMRSGLGENDPKRKTKLCNDIFFYFWDNVMAPAFAIVCTWFTVDSQESLDNLFALEFEKDDGTKVPFLNEAATQTHISNEARNSFLKPLLEEHSQNGGRHQLKELWSAWVTKKYAVVPGPINSGAAPTPPSTPPH